MAFGGVFHPLFRSVFDPGGAAAGNGLLTNLIAYWPLNEAGGANNALDLHASGLTLTQAASPGSAAGIVYGGARTFNGSTQYFSRTSESLLQTGNVDFTFAAWVYRTGAGGVFLGKDEGPFIGREYYLYVDATVSEFAIFKAGPTGMSVLGAGVSQGIWNLIFAWHNATNGTVNIQVNNGEVATTSTTGTAITTSVRFDIGDRGYNGSRVFWPGRLGPISFWKSAAGGGGVLTAAQRTALYNGGAGLAYSAYTT